jgi:hypothetical protein
MQSMIDKTFAPGPRHAAARLGRGGAIVRQHWPLELPRPLTIAQALVGQRTAETASPNPTYPNDVLTA